MTEGANSGAVLDQWRVTVVGPSDLHDEAVARVIELTSSALQACATELAPLLSAQSGRLLDVRVSQ